MQVRVLVAFLAAAWVSTAALSAQLPPVSWTCPMHPDVLEDTRGTCPICAMTLEPVRLASRWTCPVHAVIDEARPGACRICRRELVQMIAALTWTCAQDSAVNAIEPGKCPDGSAMVARYTPRPHGDHNPKHGGIFFMAPDNWHHLEGTYPAPGRFRVYVYDDYSRPLSPAQARKVRGRVVTKELFDSKTGTTRELASAPLVLSRNGAFFESRIEPMPLPAKLAAKISFASGTRESRFDFTFPAYSVDRPAAPNAERAKETAIAVSDAAALDARRTEVEALIKSGSLSAVYLPALQAKDIALRMQAELGGAKAAEIESHVRQIVLTAYELDSYGDMGDGAKVEDAFRRFSTAIASLRAATGTRR